MAPAGRGAERPRQPPMPARRALGAHGEAPCDFVSTKVMKDEGLIFSVLQLLSLLDARRLWRVQRAFLKVLDGKVIPLLALYERDWHIVSHYMDAPDVDSIDGTRYPRFEYSYDTVCVEAVRHHDSEGLRLLAWRHFDFARVRGDARLRRLAREALQWGLSERMFMLRSMSFDFSEVLAEVAAAGELSERFTAELCVSVDFLGARMSYRCSALDFACTDYVEQQLASLCSSRDNLFKVPFLLAALVHVGASACCVLRPEGCGYLLLLALASESFNFVYLVVKEAIHLGAVLELYRDQLVQMLLRALAHHRFKVVELLGFCDFALSPEESVQRQFDELIMRCLLREDFQPIEHMHRLGFSLRGFAERCHAEFHGFVQGRLGSAAGPGPSSCASAQAPPQAGACAEGGSLAAVRRLAVLDWQCLELHFRSPDFLNFVGELLARRSFVALRQVMDIHPRARAAFFVEHHFKLDSLLLDAFVLRDISLVMDLASLSYPMGLFFARHRSRIDSVLLNGWFPNKCWMELGTLKAEVKQWSFPNLFERNLAKSDDLAIGIIRNGYWFDLHHLSQLGFDFPSLFDRRFDSVSEAAIDFITMPQPHFVLLRELSALSFPWKRFMERYRDRIATSQDDDFLQFVISLDGFEPGSKVYDVVDQTCRLYHAMAASVFGARGGSGGAGAEEAEAGGGAADAAPPRECGEAVVAVAFVGLLVCSVIGAVVARNSRARVARARAAGEGLPADEQGVLSALGVRILLPWETTYTTTTTTVTSTGTSTVTTTTTTTATTTSTRTVTNTTTTSSRNPYPSLFCFSVMRADGGNELSLLRNQLERGASIFQCDFWAVYSDTKTWLTPGPPVRIETTVIDTSLEAPAGQIEHILNTDIFLQAFEQVHKHPDFERSDWVVKIDPDAVFLPDRLRTHLLSAAPEPGSNLYFWNCPASFKLFGAVEVFSKEAMNQFFQNLDKCKTEFPWQEWGEDLFLRRCMDLLGVEHKEDFGLLTDAYCGEQPFPCNSGKVAFHPFKAPETYFQCLEEATGGAPTPAPAPPAQIETAEDQPRPAAPPAVEAAAAVVPEEAAGSQEIRVLKDQPRPAAALAAEAAAARAPEDPPPPRPAAALAAEAAAALAPEEPVAATASV